MAVTIADPTTMDAAGIAAGRVLGDVRVSVKRITMDTSYPTGGYVLTPAQLGLPSGVCLFADTGMVDDGVASSVAAWYDPAAARLKAYTNAGEIANATNLSTYIVQIIAFGY